MTSPQREQGCLAEPRRRVAWLWITSICLAAILIPTSFFFVFAWRIGVFEPPEVTPIAFESSAWKRADPIERHRTVRSQMIEDLIRRRLLDGLNREKVEQLLGPPVDDISRWFADPGDWDTAYYIGMERQGAWSLDDELLAIRFDHDGRVVEYRTAVN